MGIGYNYLLPEEYQFEFPCPEELQDFYEKEADERARKLIKEEKLDAVEMDLYKSGEYEYDDIYQVARNIAREDICEKLYARRFDYVDD